METIMFGDVPVYTKLLMNYSDHFKKSLDSTSTFATTNSIYGPFELPHSAMETFARMIECNNSCEIHIERLAASDIDEEFARATSLDRRSAAELAAFCRCIAGENDGVSRLYTKIAKVFKRYDAEMFEIWCTVMLERLGDEYVYDKPTAQMYMVCKSRLSPEFKAANSELLNKLAAQA
jgi:hypothetical protein